MQCEAAEWANFTGLWDNECANESTHVEHWFDSEGVEVNLCDEHATC